AEAADLQVVLDDGEGLANLVHPGVKELALELETRTPGQIAADVKPLALDVQEHVAGKDALGGVGVMGAAGGVNVMVAGVEAVVRGIDPAFELHLDLGRALVRDEDLARLLPILGASAKSHGELPRRQEHSAAVGAVDLLLKEEVRCQALGLRRI